MHRVSHNSLYFTRFCGGLYKDESFALLEWQALNQLMESYREDKFTFLKSWLK
jgi:hypothetical protein